METEKSSEGQRFGQDETPSCRVMTRGGTVYWLSEAQEDGYRWVVREHLGTSQTSTMVVQKSPSGSVDLGDKFRGRVLADIVVGEPLELEAVGSKAQIVSEPVVSIEVGNVPAMLFG